MIGVDFAIGLLVGLAVGLPGGLEYRRRQVRTVTEQWRWTRWRLVCTTRALNRHGWARRLP